ncbi:uncharacterized protein LOC142609023 [Castanea sativa]|uniref:uncharacterized protein LOC142609023 n=1 Tax=Castanea sativa TaxID=21020 RepID=UPI003F64DEAB
MDAKESRRGSYTWQSILHDRDVIESGARWRIRDDCSVKIWQHRWLPIKHPNRNTSAPLESLEDATVDLLTDTPTRTWNTGLIAGIFTPIEAELIHHIPLARQACAEKLFWPFTQSGRYTSKFGYRFLKEAHDRVKGGNDQPVEGFWRKIWVLRVPNKIKNFILRACKDSIPTKGVELSVVRIGSMELLSHQQLRGFQRAALLDSGKSCPTRSLRNDSMDDLEPAKPNLPSYTKLQRRPTRIVLQKPKVVRKSPPIAVFKLNFDGAVFKQENKSGVSVAIRDCEGLVIASLIQLLPQAYDATDIEAIVACRALDFGQEVGIQEAVLEGDRLAIRQALKEGGISMASIKPLILDILGVL